MGRIACILVSDFPVAAIVRGNPELAGPPLALSATDAPHAELTAVSPRARAAGLRPGMTAAQARGISSELVIVRNSPAAEQSAADALLDAAQSFSPVVEAGAPGCVWLDLGGLARLFKHSSNQNGAGDLENEIAAEIGRRVRRVGMEAAV